MTGRALRSAIARINKRTRRRRTHIKRRDIRETRIRSRDRSGPRGRNEGRSSRDPIVATRANTTRDPTRARLQHDLVDRRTTDAEEHVVVHLETLDAVEDLDARTHLPLSQDECVVHKAIAAVRISGTVASNARHARSLSCDVLKNVSDNVRVFASRVVTDLLVAVWIWSNQFDLAVEPARHPVVIDLVALRAALDVVAAVLIVQVTILHAKHRTRMRKLVRCHVHRMLARAVAAVIDLDVFHQQRPRVSIGAQYSVRGTIMDHTITESDVVSVMVDAAKTTARHVETLKDVMVRQSKLHRVRAARNHWT